MVTAGCLLAIFAGPLPAHGQCRTRDQVEALLHSARDHARCNDRLLRTSTPGRCPKAANPPGCARDVVAQAIALAYGPNNPPVGRVDRRGLRSQLGCQKAIGRAVSAFVAATLRQRLDGQRRRFADAAALRRFDQLAARCDVTVAEDDSGVIVPAVGTPCEGTVGARGSRVDTEALKACLRATIATLESGIEPGAGARPNILVILTDDQRWDAVDTTHSRDGVTPVMPAVESELGAAGVTFTNAVVTTSLCCPSRASILKGEYAHTTHVLTNTSPHGSATSFDDSATLAVWLKAAGYRTGLYGKYLNGYDDLWRPPDRPYVPPGWDEWHAFRDTHYYDYVLIENGDGLDHASVNYPSGCADYNKCPGDKGGCRAPENYSTDVLLAKALQFLETQPSGQPFFLYFAPFAPHGPACPAPADEDTFSSIPPWRPPNWDESDPSDKPAWVRAQCPMPQEKIERIDLLRQHQLESLQAVDRAVRAISEKLRRLGLERDTLVLFTSDNGFSWGAHCHAPKRCPYEECLRVPLVIRYPAIVSQPRVEPRIGLNIDFAFTFAELAGALPTIRQDGRSMAALLPGAEPAWRTDHLYEQWVGPLDEGDDDDVVPPRLAEVRSTRWKWIEYATGETELYDLLSDPFELHNRAADPANVTLRRTLAARLRQLRPDWSPH